eukprot:CAMPEP_0203667738 /NCGR_PEP_ID=MMETSP0090-20130426/4522_1 /ASSEMBLY_ACC=CAM_ASM_001088 /TAXON_ID=426623 /ORGANISM="Chaetoceros affinis, Strain CCMP159" /LENGTH=186 /DNA_ID=CAMNT_0050531993 /DNA_START=148 /DNA_END=707 /DNA_ORIENTATION=-
MTPYSGSGGVHVEPPPNVPYVLACASFDGIVHIFRKTFQFESKGNTDKFNTTYEQRKTICDTSNINSYEKKINTKIYTNSNTGWENSAQLEAHGNQVVKEDESDDDMGTYSDGLWKCIGKLSNAHKWLIYAVRCAPFKARYGQIVSGSGVDSIHIYHKVIAFDDELPAGNFDECHYRKCNTLSSRK